MVNNSNVLLLWKALTSLTSLPFPASDPVSCLFAKLTTVLVREVFTMVDITTLRSEVTAIVNNLAKAVVAEIFTAAEKLSLNRQKPEAEVRSRLTANCSR